MSNISSSQNKNQLNAVHCNFKEIYFLFHFPLSQSHLHVVQSALVILENTTTLAALLELQEFLDFSDLREIKPMDNLKKNTEAQGDKKEKETLGNK